VRVAIIGAGASGYFCALQLAELCPAAEIHIFERSAKILSKVKISGGGRCNVTNAAESPATLSHAYPRHGRRLKKMLHTFGTKEMKTWLQRHDTAIYAQDDGRVFPQSDDSQTIIDLFESLRERHRIKLHLREPIRGLSCTDNGLNLNCAIESASVRFDKVVLALGGLPKRSSYDWIEGLGHKIIDPVPALFSFDIDDKLLHALSGVSVDSATVRVQGMKELASGPLLITHWGMSGPAILKLSSFAARDLHDCGYQFSIYVSWLNEVNEDKIRNLLTEHLSNQGNKSLHNSPLPNISSRLWNYLLERAQIMDAPLARALGKKSISRLVQTLCADSYTVSGKTTYKEEFVTSGGVSLESIDPKTMESRSVPGLYFTGELLDVDAITGGYNFQAAWTTAHLAAQAIAATTKISV